MESAANTANRLEEKSTLLVTAPVVGLTVMFDAVSRTVLEITVKLKSFHVKIAHRAPGRP
jgi:hypothetical protein